jgi:hypothetical protein
MTTTTTAKPASDRQRAYLTSLLADKDLTGTAYPAYDAGVITGLTSREASNAISDLLKLPRKPVTSKTFAAPKAAARPLSEITEGMWLVGDDITTGRIFKVIPSRESDRHYARELVDGDFVYAKGAMYVIAESGRRMTLDEAKQYGAITGRCCVCGRMLTDPNSIAAKIGPVCAKKF